MHRVRPDGWRLPAPGSDHPFARLTLVVGFAAFVAATAAVFIGAEKVAFLFQWLRYGEVAP
ncbi:hypothetical protein GCM10009422_25090 [Brevundimonas kwangchunensis]|uniref:Uncharacterized protein n=1 Tax=Brevundimonas kwangchunensis TaxID=322163 RepID=A0ABN1H2G1_9CAUL